MLGATIILLTALKLQYFLKPYKLDSNNNLEFNEIITGTFTVFTSIIFENEDNSVAIIDFLVFLAGNYQIILFMFSCDNQCKIHLDVAILYV